MGRKKKRSATEKAITVQPKRQPDDPEIVKLWDAYFKAGEIEDWRRLMRDLGFRKEFKSKSACRKSLKNVWVNIVDFLAAIKNEKPIHRFKSQRELSAYTLDTNKTYPKRLITEGSPLRGLLANIISPKIGEHKVLEEEMDEVTQKLGVMTVIGHRY